MSQKNITDELRAKYTADLATFLAEKYDTDVCQTAAGTLMIPVVDSNGDDRWVKFSIIIPKLADEAEGTDGYSLAQEYKLKLDSKVAKKAEAERKSAERAQKRAERAGKEKVAE